MLCDNICGSLCLWALGFTTPLRVMGFWIRIYGASPARKDILSTLSRLRKRTDAPFVGRNAPIGLDSHLWAHWQTLKKPIANLSVRHNANHKPFISPCHTHSWSPITNLCRLSSLSAGFVESLMLRDSIYVSLCLWVYGLPRHGAF